ncbi:bifunctional glutamate N-acetyltransferase/amino-acid acetyltransferase ArgJ [Sporolactobacillus spathodeae]|uniref:Arginine biosynthesis bifunctional protein ArgJ n=1 Tax=Sporolactobacillus spathodeae TaxID=1465502 RepID=A0ABS2Q770_9BACL|nr:glutamate N-acetyltransferase/amino-acid N-acetyltransferase [Sporolactobacillus spathodeae]
MDKRMATLDKMVILENGGVGTAKGFTSGGRHIGLRYKRPDLGWIVSEVPASAAGVYTTNQFKAAPLKVTQKVIQQSHQLQAVLVNSVNANSCTGEQGIANAIQTQQWAAKKLGVPDDLVAVASTGVIGVQLPMDVMEKGIEGIDSACDEATFEQAILTTDTKEKHLAVQIVIDGQPVTIGGACKGSGMIHPNMATMLGFVTTDAAIEAADLQGALKTVTDNTFNRITVDGDTSTNDMVLVLANGAAGNQPLSAAHPEWQTFLGALEYVCRSLAKMIAADGEGATKLIEVQVSGAQDHVAAEKISKAIVGSSLVKTAIFGSDANWGRIVCAIGYSGASFNPDQVSLKLGDMLLFENGMPIAFDEDEAKQYLEQDSIVIKASVGSGDGFAVAWGCDLTYNYVKINASYRS